ncbi:MAG: DNA translocase FtsK 4TM domain-containing protein [Bacilli bacterium]|nr:DNA translocase FtsK 4TM domain-containing protein [Bacilli bacterium]
MAKKKARKSPKKKGSNYQTELIGLLLIILAIIGFGRFGMIGELVSNFAAFLVGTWNSLLLVFLFLTGAYMMVKREKPNFFTSKLIGLYIIVVCILIFSHLNYIQNGKINPADIIKATIDNFLGSTKVIANIDGGGIIGAIFTIFFVKLFDMQGTTIVTWSLVVCGTVMFTGMSIAEAIKGAKDKAKSALKRKPKEKKEEVEIHAPDTEKEPEKEDNKVIVSSMEELIHTGEPKEEVSYDDKTGEIKEAKEEASHKNDNTEEVENKNYKYPSINLLSKPAKNNNKENESAIKENVPVLTQVFKDFGIDGKVVTVNIGPSVTQYEMEIKAGTKVNKILSIHREIALALAAKDVRIEAPIPGKKTVGIEIPNKNISMVTVREVLTNVPKHLDNSKLLVVLGRDIMGQVKWMEIGKTPHLLVAGSTGSGKSVCINSIIVSLLMRARPDEVKLVLVDPKKVELSMYNGVPHLLAPVVTDPKKANIVLKKIVVEMENRYELFSNSGTKNIAGYNAYLEKKNESLSEGEKIHKMPYIVVIIDELADLMLVAAKDVEDSIMRITQMARAAGIHLIVATQRPSTDVITGVVKANIPSRISFAVSSSIDSRTILDATGAEKLLGKGDMLFLPQGENTPIRIQGTFVSEEEIKGVVDYTISQQKARYDETLLMDDEESKATSMVEGESDYEEPLYNEIVEFVVTQGKASASLLQRRFRLGYNRAARCIDLLEDRGIIGPANGSKPREVLVKVEQNEE